MKNAQVKVFKMWHRREGEMKNGIKLRVSKVKKKNDAFKYVSCFHWFSKYFSFPNEIKQKKKKNVNERLFVSLFFFFFYFLKFF